MGLSIRALPFPSLQDGMEQALYSARTSRSLSIVAHGVIRPTVAVASAKCFILAHRFHKMAAAKNQQGDSKKALADLARSASLAVTGLFLAYGALNAVGLKEMFLTPTELGERMHDKISRYENEFGCKQTGFKEGIYIFDCPGDTTRA